MRKVKALLLLTLYSKKKCISFWVDEFESLSDVDQPLRPHHWLWMLGLPSLRLMRSPHLRSRKSLLMSNSHLHPPSIPTAPPPLCPSHLTLSWRGQFMLKFNCHVSVLKSLLSSAARITKSQREALFPSETCRCNSMFRWPNSKWFRFPYLSRFCERLGLLPVCTPKLVSALCKKRACRVLPYPGHSELLLRNSLERETCLLSFPTFTIR